MNSWIIFAAVVWLISHAVIIALWVNSTPEEFKSIHKFLWTRLNIIGRIVMWPIYFLICPLYTFIKTCNYLFVKKEYKGE